MKSAADILQSYKNDVARWQANNSHYVDIRPLTVNEIITLKMKLHPTAKRESLDMTKRLIELMCDREIITAQEIYTELACVDKPILKRIRILREYGLLRRESKKFYLPTPRLQELRKRYLHRLCE